MKLLYYSFVSFADCDFPLIKAFQEKGVDVTYIIELVPYRLRSTLFEIKEMIPVNDIIPATRYKELQVYSDYMDMSKVYVLNNTSYKQSSLTTFKLVWKLIKFIKREKFDAIHSEEMFSMQHLWLLFFRNWIKTIHDPFPHSGESSLRGRIQYKLNIKFSKGLVLLNNEQLNSFCQAYNRSPKDILINRLGVYDNITTFCKGVNNQKTKNVLFFGRISPYKGIEYLCQAMLKVKEQVPDSTLTIAGRGQMYFDITEYEKLPWVDVRNRFIGMEELADLIENCSLSVCPYTDATQSGVVMTSYGLGKPVVVTNTGGLPEQVDDGRTGFIVEPRSVDQLAEKIIKLLKDDLLRNRMSENIKEDYLQGEKSWSAIADKYIEFYKKMKS